MVEIVEEKIDDGNIPFTIDRIRDKILVKLDRMNEQSRPINSIEDEKSLYVKYQYKDT